MKDQIDITQLLQRWSEGDKEAINQAWPLIYNELHQLARHYLAHERRNHTLVPTAIINEAFLKLNHQYVRWQNRAHFLGVAANIMRRVLRLCPGTPGHKAWRGDGKPDH